LGNRFPVENPFPILAQLREAGPLAQIPLPSNPSQKAWVVTRMSEAVQVLKDYEHFTVDMRAASSDSPARRRAESLADTVFMGQSMISVDEPDHRRLRGLVSKAFTPKYIAGLRPSIQRIADDLLDRVQEQGRMDVVDDYGYPLPITVISDMLGVPSEMREQIRQWSLGLSGGRGDQDRLQSIRAFSQYIALLVAEKRQRPGDDLISQLVHLEDEGDHLSENELLSMVGLLIFAGHETTSNLIGIGTLMLLTHPEQFEQLKADPSLVASTVEELLRFNGPVLTPAPRFVAQDIEFGGQHLKQGELLIVVLGSADRDERQFTDPDDMQIARDLNRHIAFGQGIHVCLGAPLARLEADIAFTTLLRRLPNLQLASREEVQWRISGTLRGLISLPVTF
jgi:cytochrome P450